MKTATFAGGCFWCMEAVFERVKGVSDVICGYSGGDNDKPSYDQIKSGSTNHAESVQIFFDDTKIRYLDLLDIFWHLHDPTTLNRQGNDIGTQYRSVIFYHDEEQKKLAEKSKEELIKERVYKDNIVTEIIAFKNFFEAEDHHQDYYRKNSSEQFCQIVIAPKIKKLLEEYKYLT